jgi:hypothetical protein
MIEIIKKCTKCKESYPISFYNDNPNGKDFKKSQCKTCESIYNRGYARIRKEKYLKFRSEQASLFLTSTQG